MNGFALGMLGVLLLPTLASAQYAAPPVGTWAQLPNTSVYPAQPFEAKSESAPGGVPELWSPESLFAYSGADVAQRNGVWGFLIWGGGHAATPDNSLYWVPFDGLGARRLTGPYLAPDKVYRYDDPLETYRSVSRNAPPTVTVAAAPKSRHTYSGLLVIAVNGRPAMFNYGGSLHVGSGSGTNATRVFDLSQTYAQAMARPDMGWALKAPAPSGVVAASSGWDPVQKRVVTRTRSFIGAYYPDTDRWENWNIQNFPGGGDNQSGVAMDVVGRKMYVLGDKLAEMIDLDTKVWTDLRRKPWWNVMGNALGWHARTRQIVSWWGGQNLTLINPATDAVKTVTMGGATVTPGFLDGGIYGRFRVIPGTDQVVLVNGVGENVFIGTVPFDGVQPTPTPTPTPISTPIPTPGSAPTGQFLGVTGEDKVGQMGQATPNGTPDWHLRVQNIKSAPATVRVDAFVNGVSNGRWVSPFNGTNWVLAKQFASGQLDVWFEPYQVPTTFNVTVSYADGTTASVTGIPSGLTPPPPPPGGADVIRVPAGRPIPARHWVERPTPPVGHAYMASGGKHGRAFYHAGLKAMVFAGGDWHTTQPQYEGYGDGAGSEIWSLDVLNDRWTLQRPFCVPEETQPGGPDTVGWAYDSKRNRGLMTPGFYFITQGVKDLCGSIYGWGAYAFDLTTKKFSGPDAVVGMPPPPGVGWSGDLGASYATYNPTLDEYVRVFGTQLQSLNLSTKTWRLQNLSNGNPHWNPNVNRAQLVLDVQGQALYWLDVWSSPRALIKITVADGRVTSVPLPASYAPVAGLDHEVYLAFDPQSRVILIPNNYDMGTSPIQGLGIYHVDTGQWEWEAVPPTVYGSVWGFDEATGALLGIGKRARPSAYFLYKYSATRQPTR